MSKRHQNAHDIWHGGACNPQGIARALVSAIDEACSEGRGSDGANDPAVHMIIDHLCFIVDLPQPSLEPWLDWDAVLKANEEARAAALLEKLK